MTEVKYECQDNHKPLPLYESEESPYLSERKMRPCILCKKKFDSAWPGNRICPKCKTKEYCIWK